MFSRNYAWSRIATGTMNSGVNITIPTTAPLADHELILTNVSHSNGIASVLRLWIEGDTTPGNYTAIFGAPVGLWSVPGLVAADQLSLRARIFGYRWGGVFCFASANYNGANFSQKGAIHRSLGFGLQGFRLDYDNGANFDGGTYELWGRP